MEEQKKEKTVEKRKSLSIDATLILMTGFLAGGVVVLTTVYVLLK